MLDKRFNVEMIHLLLKRTLIMNKVKSELQFDICD